jgi:hypothetical protein
MSKPTAYDLCQGDELAIGKRRWMLLSRMPEHPHHMTFAETTTHEASPIRRRVMYPSEVQAMLDAGFPLNPPRKT